MLFSSIPFLYYFLPVTLFVYYLAPEKCKNFILLIASLIFYGWGEPRFVFVLIGATILGYVFGLLIGKSEGTKWSKVFLILSVISSVGMLLYFKLGTFFPIGVSFYTFQLLSYTIDVYRKEVKPQKNFVILAAYVSMFPQLIAGPIVRYSDIEMQLLNRKLHFSDISEGIRRFVLGLGKKILIANALGELCEIFKASNDKSVAFFWLYAVAFMLHIYFDFSGYSDMAIGLGKMLGFEFMENFNYPYISANIAEFWRRWHISLGSWFRDYVYIPLGGNRTSRPRWLFNIAVVWFLTGFWHGAAWNFIVWGMMFAVLLLLEKYVYGGWLKKSKILSHIYVLFFILISFVIFNAADLKEGISYIAAMFGFGGYPLIGDEFVFYLKNFDILLLIGIIGATPLPKRLFECMKRQAYLKKGVNLLEIAVLLVLMILMTAYLVDGSFNPFLYFRF